MIIQFCGLSGSGKTTIAQIAKEHFLEKHIALEIIDGDEYRQFLCADLGFSKEDRIANIRRLAFVAGKLARHRIIPIICAINPYEEVRKEIAATYADVKTIFIKCPIAELIRRDPKGLYARALLPQHHLDRIDNLSGINDPFEIPASPDLVIETDKETAPESGLKLVRFIEQALPSTPAGTPKK